jgi:hypothetical protein
MAEEYLGRVGTVVELMMKRPTQPHPVTATLRRQEGEYMCMQHLAIPVSSLDCNLHPYKILERIRFAEKTLLQVSACAGATPPNSSQAPPNSAELRGSE